MGMRLQRLATGLTFLVVVSLLFKILSDGGGGADDDGGEVDDDVDVNAKARSRRPERRKNVLFMITDDMRAQLGCYSDKKSPFGTVTMHTPNLDRLAGESLLLKNAFVQYTLCCPSRSSMLTGRRPDVTGVRNNEAYWRDLGYNFTTLPQYFKQNGYRTIGIAKVFHKFKDLPSWTEYQKFGNPEKNVLEFSEGATWLAYTERQNEENPLSDVQATNRAVQKLEELAAKAKTGEEPFFLAIGFNKPHVSFVCPERYFELYPIESARRYLARLDWQTPTIRQGTGMKNVTLIDGQLRMADGVLREHRRAYFACISYIDDLVGELLAALDRLGLADDTVVVFVADHGYHLGENGQFGKNLLTDVSSRVPMIIRIPGRTDAGIVSESIVEALDLYPTVVRAAGLEPPPPACPNRSQNVAFCTQGESLLPLLDDPEARIKETAFTQMKFGSSDVNGYSLRTERYRYTEYVRIVVAADGGSAKVFIDLKDYPSELYDHAVDKEEAVNRASSSKYTNVRNELRKMLHQYIEQSNGVSKLYPDVK